MALCMVSILFFLEDLVVSVYELSSLNLTPELFTAADLSAAGLILV